jgi:hypothetical protein
MMAASPQSVRVNADAGNYFEQLRLLEGENPAEFQIFPHNLSDLQ